MNPQLAAALRYARSDWPVFPCRPGEKLPATRHGFLDASTDTDKITWWWSRNPGRNVAIATGRPGPDVLDVDVREDGSGFAAFNRLLREGHLDGASAYVRTPSGGMHAYFTGSEQGNGTSAPVAATSSLLPPGSAAGPTSCSNSGRPRPGWTGQR